ncbi:MAG TPA: glycosyltransferase [Candidatus Poseidoniaceae archaeon]|nr:MAG TPA: glycosyltransferase [Candidatus Poseidoniales archaeon]DAC58084.1 MAG TPA: glycosyltransferase [Candidatus Poseidoniales archaeon]HII23030.1 glycosyltransferase [Candidatus Poseidoniaceae archaeon]HII50938.1 glycosyltransferase [Candidatus Poseidoniaceae archaeon]|tara:strand:+ start:373 stop:1428 length:1056 start_codon:yes stop_codon:yes gene_type:complete
MAGEFTQEVASVIPVLNEESTIIECLESLCNQSYPKELHSIYIFDGGSSDSTYQLVSEFIANKDPLYPEISLHKNPGKYVAEARNLALEIIPNSVDYLLEIIGHCTIGKNHIESMIDVINDLHKSSAKPVGALGVKVESRDGDLGLTESWIEAGLSSSLASGSGQFSNFSGTEKTNVPAFCLHSRKALDDVGGWDTSFITSQDSDISMRMINAGYQLYRTDVVAVKMAKRYSLLSWGKMGFRYGFWRTKLLKRHRRRASLREFLPWIGIIITMALLFSGVEYWYVPAGLYAVVLGIEGIRTTIVKRNLSMIVGTPLAIIILHTSFSIGLIYGLFGKSRSFNDRESNNGNLN